MEALELNVFFVFFIQKNSNSFFDKQTWRGGGGSPGSRSRSEPQKRETTMMREVGGGKEDGARVRVEGGERKGKVIEG